MDVVLHVEAHAVVVVVEVTVVVLGVVLEVAIGVAAGGSLLEAPLIAEDVEGGEVVFVAVVDGEVVVPHLIEARKCLNRELSLSSSSEMC